MKSQYAMVLYPQDSLIESFFEKKSGINKEQLIEKLTNDGFLGDFFCVNYDGQEEQTGYFIGDNFLKLITFLGCSPHLAVALPKEISDWNHFCHIELQQFQSPKFFKGLNRPKCSCSQCKSRLTLKLSDLDSWTPGSMKMTCSKCQYVERVEELNWRHSAGFGAFFIVVHSVYPSEAIPTEQLMMLLKQNSLNQWDYFYYEH